MADGGDGQKQSRTEGLRFGPLGRGTIHLCVDMQVMFAEKTDWHTPWMERVLPRVTKIAERHAERTVFTRFIPARSAEEAPGTWRRYYERWPAMTLSALDPGMVDLVPPLRTLVPPGTVVDKPFYSPWLDTPLDGLLRERGADALVVTGAETDVCVLAAVMGAVDRGLRTVVATDAVCSSSDPTHDALMQLYHERYGQHIETAETQEILAAWAD